MLGGRFTLANNDLKIDEETMLQHYKGQRQSNMVSDSFRTEDSRLLSLAMIVVLTPLVYSIGEWLLRK